MSIDIDTQADHDAAIAEKGVRHPSDTVYKDYLNSDEGGTALERYFRLDETGGTTATDSTGNQDGTYVNSPSLGNAGILGSNAPDFTRTSNQRVDLGQITNLEGASEVTVALWMKADELPSTSGVNLGVFVYGDSFSNRVGMIHVGAGDDLDVGVETGNDPATVSIPHSSLNTTDWFHVAFTFDTGTTEAYVDGSSVGTASMSTETTTPASISSQAAIGMTRWAATSNDNRYFDGMVDEVRIYSRALTSAQITELYETAV